MKRLLSLFTLIALTFGLEAQVVLKTPNDTVFRVGDEIGVTFTGGSTFLIIGTGGDCVELLNDADGAILLNDFDDAALVNDYCP